MLGSRDSEKFIAGKSPHLVKKLLAKCSIHATFGYNSATTHQEQLMPSLNRLLPSLTILAMLFASSTRADDFKEDSAKVTIHAPDGWKKTEEKKSDDVMKLTIQTGVPAHSDDYYVAKLGHIVDDVDETIDQFKDTMVKSFPADWKHLDEDKTTAGKKKLPALHVAYSFESSGIPFRVDLYLFKRGRQFTFFEFVGTAKAWETMHDQLIKIVHDADIETAGDK